MWGKYLLLFSLASCTPKVSYIYIIVPVPVGNVIQSKELQTKPLTVTKNIDTTRDPWYCYEDWWDDPGFESKLNSKWSDDPFYSNGMAVREIDSGLDSSFMVNWKTESGL